MALDNYIILVENEISKWDDSTGKRYHFPRRYLDRLKEGMKAIYYKGRFKKNGPHYFGYCEVSKIYPVAGSPGHYHADLINYKDFNHLVPFKLNNQYLEEAETSKYFWQNSVRQITEERFCKILELAELNLTKTGTVDEPFIVTKLPPISEVNITMATSSLIKINKPKTKRQANELNANYFNSKKTTLYGNQGEHLVMKHLTSTLTEEEVGTLRHHAVENEKDGYDISYTSLNGDKVYIEVKATSATSFPNFIITINELMAAIRYGHAYQLYLVNKVTSKNASIEVIKNIAGLLDQGNFVKNPIAFKVEMINPPA